MMNSKLAISVLLMAVSVASHVVTGNDQIPGAPQSKPILIRGATVHCVDAPTIENGSVLFDDGRIVAVGVDLGIPGESRVIEAAGKHVYPGLIESMTDLGLREILGVDVTIDSSELGDRNPNVRSWVAVNPDSELIPVARAGGVLVAHVTPGGRFVRGQSAVMQLDGWTAKEMNLRAPNGLCVNWESLQPDDKEPAEQAKKRDKKLQELHDWFDEAARYGQARNEDQTADISDLRLESLQPILNGELPVFAVANRLLTIESAVAFAVARNIKLVIYGGYDAAHCAELLKRYEVPVIIGGTYRLPMHRHDPYDAPYTLPERLRQAGVIFAISGEGLGYPGGSSNARNLPYHAANAVAYGLARDEAIKSITLSAAEILGVHNRIGSISVGKDATLIISDGDILESETNLTAAFIQGRAVDLSSKHTMLFDKYKKKYQVNR
jgi:imidazolonepropionase-like amidohydrolase